MSLRVLAALVVLVALAGASRQPPASIPPAPVLASFRSLELPAPKPARSCFHRSVNLTGATPGADVLIGRTGRDVVRSKAGDDFVAGLSGADRICGGKGSDTLNGGDGFDRLDGGPGYDTCREGESVKRCEAYQ